MTYPVKYFTSTMQGAPQLTNDWGVLTDLLDACLVNGFNLKAVDALTSAGGVATATLNAGHLYEVGQILTMAGATQPEYNGEVRVLATTTTTFTYAISGTPASPATGTLSAKVAPLGWSIAFTGTHKRAYRSNNVASNRPYLRVDDGLDPAYTTTYAKWGKVTLAEGMSDIDTFVGARAPFDPANPSKNEVASGSGDTVYNGWYKWVYAHAYGGGNPSAVTDPGNSVRAWVLVGDDRGFYLFNQASPGDGGLRAAYCCTDFESFRTADRYNTLLAAKDYYLYADANLGYNVDSETGGPAMLTLDYTGKVLMRDHTQVGGNVRAAFTALNTNNAKTRSGYQTGIPWPNPADYGLLLHPTYLMQEGANMGLRGRMPGMLWVLNDRPMMDLAKVSGVVGYPGREFLLVRVGVGPGMVAFDLTGPWYG